MDMTIDQQVELDEALVPHAIRLRIGKSNFRLRSDITSKESTLQYDVLRLTHFYKAFLVTADVFEIYMQEFWENATTFDELLFEEEILAFLRYLGHSGEIRKLSDGMYHKKNVDFAYLMWEDFVYQVEHKDAKKSNEMYYPRFIKVIIHFFMTKDPSIPRRNKVNWHYVRDDQMFTTIKLVSRHQNSQQFGAMLPVELTNKDIRNSTDYKEYYAIASGAAPPKTKASVRKTQSSSDNTMPPPTSANTRLSTSAKDKQPAKSSKAKGLSVLSEVAMTEAEHMKLAKNRSLQQTHISQASGYGADEGTCIIPGVPDVSTDESDEEISWKSTDEDDDEVDDRSDDQEDDDDQDDNDQDDNDDDQDTDNDSDDFIHPKLSIHEEEAKDEESFDHIVQTSKNSDDEGNDDASLGMNVGGEEGHDADDDNEELYRDVNINLEASTTVASLTLSAPTLPPPTILTISQFAGAVSSIHGIVERYMDQRINEAVKVAVQIQSNRLRDEAQAKNEEFLNNLDENIQRIIKEQVKEQVKIIIKKMESNKSIHRSDEQRNLYKALVDAYECDKIILDIYGDTVTLKIRRDDADKDEEPFAGSDRGYKRKRKGKELESTSAPKEKASKTTGKSTKGSKSHQKTASESTPAEEPMQTTQHFKRALTSRNKTLPANHGSIQPWISDLAKQADSRSSFNELMDTPVNFSAFLMNRLKVDTLTPELLAGPTYELMKGSCKSLVKLEFFQEEVYKATTNQLDWNNPEGQQYPHNLLKPLPLIPNS
nr:hypothetical protein [Tanacetum cinerariifolium]